MPSDRQSLRTVIPREGVERTLFPYTFSAVTFVACDPERGS